MPATGEFVFGPYRLDARSRRLFRADDPLALSARHFDILAELVSRPGEVVTKEQLIQVAWQGVAVGDNSIEKAVGYLRRTLDPDNPSRYLDTLHRRGYAFTAQVTRVEPTQAGVDIDALLAPHRAWIDGRAAIETLRRDDISRARSTFAELIARHPNHAIYHVGMATACVLEFEATRADEEPNVAALTLAATHAHAACRLSPDAGEAWATLGFVLERTGDRPGAIAALQRATMIEPDNWLNQVRLAAASWGEERLRAARRTLALCPHFPMAHWLAATVWVARDRLEQAEQEIDAGLLAMDAESNAPARFAAVALHYLKGLLCLARGATGDALAAFDRELALEAREHLYARECCANTWYAKGVCRLRQCDLTGARAAFAETLMRVPRHPMAHAALALFDAGHDGTAMPAGASIPFELTLARAASLVAADDHAGAVRLVAAALSTTASGSAGWLILIEPSLRVWENRGAWAPVLSALYLRAR